MQRKKTLKKNLERHIAADLIKVKVAVALIERDARETEAKLLSQLREECKDKEILETACYKRLEADCFDEIMICRCLYIEIDQ